MKPICHKPFHSVNHQAMNQLASWLANYPALEGFEGSISPRIAVFDDLVEMVVLEERGYQGYVAWSLEDFQRDWRLNRHGVYIVLEAGKVGPIIGMVTGRFIEGYSHISHLVIDPAWQGQGLGAYLLEVWLRASQVLGKKVVELEVRESNCRAQRLYYRFGFKQVSRKEFYYEESGETALLLRCSLREWPLAND